MGHLPSFFFLLLYSQRKRFPVLFSIFNFSRPYLTLVILFSSIGILYIIKYIDYSLLGVGANAFKQIIGVESLFSDYTFKVFNMWLFLSPLGILILLFMGVRFIKNLKNDPFLIFLFYTTFIFLAVSFIFPAHALDYISNWDCYSHFSFALNLFCGLSLLQNIDFKRFRKYFVPCFIYLSIFYGSFLLKDAV